MDYQTITLTVQDDYAILTLNRPESLNSINLTMHAELKDALKAIEKNKPRALLLTGNGRGFCSGQDLSDRSVSSANTTRRDLGVSLETKYNPLMKTLYNLSIPTVCAVNGVAAGAGASLALCCDFVIANESTRFPFSFSKIGLIPDSSLTWLLPKIIGFSRAKAVMMLGQDISMTQAYELGMVWQVCPADEVHDEATKLTQHLATMPTVALTSIKTATLQSWNNTLNQQLDLERDMQRHCGFTDDYQEGVSSFFEKRSPHFKGA